MSEEAPTTPVVEPSTPTAPAPETPAAPASEPAQTSMSGQTAQAPATASAESANNYFTNEQLTELQNFVHNNGDWEKAWPRIKNAISRPPQTAQPVTQPEAPQAPSAQQMAQTPVQNPQAPQNGSQGFRVGSISMEEMAAMQYFDGLAADPKYANIADEIRSGAVLKGLKDFNINPLENGRINDGDVRKYLDLYAATKPAKPTSSEPANSMAMADDLSNIKEVTSLDEANRIQLDNIRRRAAGQPENGLEEKAKAYLKARYSEMAKNGR